MNFQIWSAESHNPIIYRVNVIILKLERLEEFHELECLATADDLNSNNTVRFYLSETKYYFFALFRHC